MPTTSPDLDPLFDPNSIAVVGASPDSFYSGTLVDNLLEYGFEGTLYPVNPSRDEVWGRKCFDDIDDVPEKVDLVVVSVPREYVVDVVSAAGERGVPVALVLTAGFSEADEDGAELETQLADAADEAGIRVVGPNCIGVMASEGATITPTCTREPQSGGIGLVSQSGALAFTTFFERAADQDIHFSHIVSTGNEADLSTADYIEYLAEKDTVDVITAYIEGISDPDRFLHAAEKAIRNGTPVLTVKIGKSDIAEEATLSHTGSLTGDDDAWEAAFDQVGIQRVPDIPDLLSRASAYSTYDPPEGNNVCIASTSGGLGSLLADMSANRDLGLPDIEGETEQALLDMDELLTYGEFNNPADIRGYGVDVISEIADILLADDSFDAYVFALGISGVDEQAAEVTSKLEKIVANADDPVYVLWTGRKQPENRSEIPPYASLRSSVPVYEDPGRAMDAVASTTKFVEDRTRLNDRPSRAELVEELTNPDIDVPQGRVLTWTESEQLLDAFDIPLLDSHIATDEREAIQAANELGFPVVLKIDSPALPHRTDIGAVELGIESPTQVREAFQKVMDAAQDHADADEIEGVIVQPMISDGVESIAGVAPDDVFGSTITVGPGGVLVEALDEAATLIPPFTQEDAIDAIDKTALMDLLVDRRDGPPLSPDDLADLIVNLGNLAYVVDEVAEIDLNPVLVTENGPIAVDALIRTR